jgi:hypothetical protein
LIYPTSCREIKGREIIIEIDPEPKIRTMQKGGYILIRGVAPRRETLFH